MTYGEAKAMVLVIIDEYTTHGEATNDKDIEARLPWLLDAALCEVPCNWKRHVLQTDMDELTPLPVEGKVAQAVCYNVAAKVTELDLVVSNEPLVKKYHELMHEEWMARYALGESLKWLPPELRMSAEMFEAMGPTPEERAKAKRREFWLEVMKIAAGLLLYWAMALAALVVLVFLFN